MTGSFMSPLMNWMPDVHISTVLLQRTARGWRMELSARLRFPRNAIPACGKQLKKSLMNGTTLRVLASFTELNHPGHTTWNMGGFISRNLITDSGAGCQTPDGGGHARTFSLTYGGQMTKYGFILSRILMDSACSIIPSRSNWSFSLLNRTDHKRKP